MQLRRPGFVVLFAIAGLSACTSAVPDAATTDAPSATQAAIPPPPTVDDVILDETEEDPSKECPLSSLTIADALSMAQPGSDGALVDEFTGSDSLLPISLSIESVLWHSTAFGADEGSDVSANLYWPTGSSASAATFGLEDDWLEGTAEPKLMVLYSTYFPDASSPWDVEVLGQRADGTMEFGADCYLERFGQLADDVGRQPDLSLYLDLLTEHATYFDCREAAAQAASSGDDCAMGPVLAAANAIDDALPGF